MKGYVSRCVPDANRELTMRKYYGDHFVTLSHM